MGRAKEGEVHEGCRGQMVQGLMSHRREWGFILKTIGQFLAFPGGSDGKESACNLGDLVRTLG